MSTSRHGPVIVPKSPSLEHQFASMSVSGAASSSSASTSASAPQPPALNHPKVLAYFEEQRKIGAQWPKNPYPMKYDISVYRLADGAGSDKCLASIDSRDWRQRELSIRITDAAIDILDEVLRKPIAEESVRTWTDPKRPSVADLKKTHVIETVPFADVTDFAKIPPAITRCERKRFPTDAKAERVLLGVSPTTLQQIGLKVLSHGALGPEHNPGPVLLEETTARIQNIYLKAFQSEFVCMKWLANSPFKPSVKRYDGSIKTFHQASPITGFSCELSRRLIRQLGMDRRLVHSLLEKYIRDSRTPKEEVETLVATIEKGLTEEMIGILSL